MLIIADENIPFVREAFGTFGEVIAFPGRNLQKERIKDGDVLLVRSVTRVNRELLEGTRIRFVATATIGTDHIDTAYLKKRKIGFASAQGSNANSVAEYVMTAILCLANRMGFSISGKSLGVIGAGNVGSRVVKMARGIGMEVLENDPPLARKARDKHFREIEDVVKADIITLHVPLTYRGRDATFHMVNKKFLAGLKKGAIFINTSRGAVAETNAVREAIKKKNLLATVIDVWENEPEIDIGLLGLVNIATPHIAGYSVDGKVNGTAMIYNACTSFFGIKAVWKQGKFMSEELEIEAGNSDEEMLWHTIRKLYDIERDDSALRRISGLKEKDRGAYFDRLRREYPARREFFNAILRINRNSKNLMGKFLSLGFRVEQI